jgi:hypothetical protein
MFFMIGPVSITCPECQKLTLEFASATTEVIAHHDIRARTRARMEISQQRLRWLKEAQATWYAIKEKLDAHRRTTA